MNELIADSKIRKRNGKIDDDNLYDGLEKLPFSAEEFEFLAEKMLVSTTQMKEMLNCSRQNIDDLVKRDKLHPVDIQAKTKLFRKSEVQEWSWK